MVSRILFIPPDTRPQTLDLPLQLAQMVGADLRMPPLNSLPRFIQPGETTAQRYWLYQEADEADILVLNLETLTLGGTLPARRSQETLATVLRRLEVLRELRRRHADLKILAHAALLQIPHTTDTDVDRENFTQWHEALTRYGVAADRLARYGENERPELEAATAALPAEVLSEWLEVRERQKQLHLAALELVREGVIHHLALTTDKQDAYGLGALERRELESRIDEMGLWPQIDLYPGGDEACTTLLARALAPERQSAWVMYSAEHGADSQLLQADRSAAAVVRTQLRAAGCIMSPSLSEADFVLLINTPGQRQGVKQPDSSQVDTVERNLPAFVDVVAEQLEGPRPVVLADVAYYGSAEVRLWNMMQRLPLARLSGYAAWDSASNSLGTAIAFGKLSRHVKHPELQRRALFERLAAEGMYPSTLTSTLLKLKRLKGLDPQHLGTQQFALEKALRIHLPRPLNEFWDMHFAAAEQGSAPLHVHLNEVSMAWPRLHSLAFRYELSESEPVLPEIEDEQPPAPTEPTPMSIPTSALPGLSLPELDKELEKLPAPKAPKAKATSKGKAADKEAPKEEAKEETEQAK